MKNLVIILGTIILGTIIVSTLILGDEGTLQGAASNAVSASLAKIGTIVE